MESEQHTSLQKVVNHLLFFKLRQKIDLQDKKITFCFETFGSLWRELYLALGYPNTSQRTQTRPSSHTRRSTHLGAPTLRHPNTSQHPHTSQHPPWGTRTRRSTHTRPHTCKASSTAARASLSRTPRSTDGRAAPALCTREQDTVCCVVFCSWISCVLCVGTVVAYVVFCVCTL